MSTIDRLYMNDLTKSFRNTALIFKMDSVLTEYVRIARAKDDYQIATSYRFWNDRGYPVYVVTMTESGQTYSLPSMRALMSFLEADRHFPAKVEQCRSWSKPVYKETDF